MPDILHRISIDAPREAVHDLVATTDGIARWWTGRPLEGDSAVGSRFGIYFGDAGAAAAAVRRRRDDAAVRPRRWAEASEFMSGCSTNWGAYLTSLKAGAEGTGFRPYPQAR
jgi:hypothetical protein